MELNLHEPCFGLMAPLWGKFIAIEHKKVKTECGIHPLNLKYPKRWILERTFAWFEGYCILNKDFEFRTETSQTMIQISYDQIDA